MGSFGNMSSSKAIIYCRVSSEKQVKEGNGLAGQEKRCRDYAKLKGYKVQKVFRDEGFSGGITNRPAMQELISFLKHSNDQYVVIFDDIKRFSRSIEGHFELKSAICSYGATIECPAYKFEDTAEGKLVESVYASVAEYERNSNRVQVTNRMKARLEMGFWIHPLPIGYKFGKDALGNKLPVPDEPKASIIKEVLEGFANDRFVNQIDVQKFLDSNEICYKGKYKKVYLEQVKRILTNPLYAGRIIYPKWGIDNIEGKHEALISWDTYQKNQLKLTGKAKTPFRKDLNEDFPLRGFVLCRGCQKPLTASWSKGRNRKYPFYRCNNKKDKCIVANKSIRKEILESKFEESLMRLSPKRDVLDLTKVITLDLFNQKMGKLEETIKIISDKIKTIDLQIENLVEKILKTESMTVQKVLEAKIDELEKEKVGIHQSLEILNTKDINFGTALDRVSNFIKNPYQAWKSANLSQKQRIQRMIYTRPIMIDPEKGVGTEDLSIPFKVLGDSSLEESHMVERRESNPLVNYLITNGILFFINY